MIPVQQICPKCRQQFEGSDIVGSPCPPCEGLSNIDPLALSEALNQMYYLEDEKDDRTITN